jgi:hypothetical protein
VCDNAFGEAIEGVAAFKEADDASVGGSGGNLSDPGGEVLEIFVCEVESTERISFSGIESCTDENQFRAELFHRGDQGLFEGPENLFARASGGKWAVECGADPCTSADLAGASGPGIPRMLVGAEEEDVRILVKGILRSISMVDVPIDDEDLLDAEMFACVGGGDGDIVEHAEAHADFGACVVPWGADDAEGGFRSALDDGFGCGDGATGGGEGGLP